MFGFKHGRLGSAGTRTLIQRAIASLRARGTDAHLWLPGVGTINGLTTGNYLESTGNTVATVDNPTGLVLDALGSVSATELVTNGDGSTLTGWTSVGTSTATIESGRIKLTCTGAPSMSGGYRQDIATVANKSYKISIDIDVTAIGTGRAQILVYDGAAFTPELLNIQKTALGTYALSGIVKATGTTIRVYFLVAADSSTTTTAYFDNISVREVTGIHLTQGTTANKPLLRRGLTNLLTYSNDFSQGVWGAASWTISASDTLSPFGDLAGKKLTASAVPAALARNYTAISTEHTAAFVFKPGTFATPSFAIRNNTTATMLVQATYVGINNSGSGAYGSFDFSDFGENGWKICRITCTSGITIGNTLNLYYGATGAVTDGTYFYEYSAGLFQGTLTAAQILAAGGIPVTTTAAASNPDAGKYSWSFDGSNDSLLSTATTSSSGWFVIALKANVLAHQAPFGNNDMSNAIGYSGVALKLRSTGDVWLALQNGDGTSSHNASTVALAAYTANELLVLSGKWSYPGTQVLRKNGLQIASTATVYDPTSIKPIYIGAALGVSERLNGEIYNVSYGQGAITDSELLQIERLAANAAGITL